MKNNRISTIAHSTLLRSGLLAILFLVCAVLLSLSGSRVSSKTSTPKTSPQAQDEIKPVARLIRDAKSAGSDFATVEPFNRQTRSAAADLARRRAVKAGSLLQLRANALTDLVNRKAQSLTLSLPTFAGPPVELELVQVDIFAKDFNVITSDTNGQPVTYDPGVHYWGGIKGVENSLATISIFKDEVIGMYSSPQEGNFVLGKLAGKNPAGDYILYAEKDLSGKAPLSCHMPDDNTAYTPEELETPPAAVFRCTKIYIETDFDLFQNKGSVTAVTNYVTGFFNQSAALYNNEGIPITISQIFVWTTPSPYTGANSQTQLAQFQATRTSFNGDFAHLVDLQPQGGIAAGFDGLCNANRSQSECYSGIFPTYSDVPTYSWTVEVFTHEMGHLFGSRHTHACVWNGNGTAIDGCSGVTEGGCPLPGNPPDGGTIMSYCHTQSVGINFSKGFGPQPGNVIRNRFNNASCLGTCGQPDSPTVRFDQASLTVNEGVGAVIMTVTRSGPTTPAVTVDYATSDGSASQKGDYTLALGKISFASGETSKTFPIFITDDGYVEGNETFTVTLTNPTGGALGVPSQTTITIVNNDSVATQPIDGASFFVRQHYRDFLNRDPDQSGWDFWTNQITSCGSDTQCIEIKRINVSAAFFLSIEFQQTGYLTYRFYKAALNRPNGLPRYLELMRDTQKVGRGVVVGAPGWEAQLEANKVAYANEFVSRTEFIILYPTSQTPAQFVDALYAHAGITPSSSERQAAIDEFNNPTGARGRVLRRVADNQTFFQLETNRAFVLMQYFGYLRRNPDDPPDNNLDGYNFWLNKLNQFNGNFVDAEMVKAFITSPEYRQRFGP
ncbi:MAG TPA: Calx-beta domain-containing protein [Pyrinomonadaceae bacterium]|nr:Calx-beta domain-containing protein [Pyrinomonadaceae bacterium]